jgi:predicted RNase H-like HicB family nuclease
MERFTAVYEYDGEWWVGYVEEVPGANTQGRTLDEARDNLKDAVQLLIESNRQEIQRLADGRNVVREELLVPLT